MSTGEAQRSRLQTEIIVYNSYYLVLAVLKVEAMVSIKLLHLSLAAVLLFGCQSCGKFSSSPSARSKICLHIDEKFKPFFDPCMLDTS